VKHDLANLERELAKLEEEMRELRVLKAEMADQRLRQEQEIRNVKHDVELLRKASDSQRRSQERQTEAVAEVRKVVGQLAGQYESAISKRSRSVKSREIARAKEQLRVQAARLNGRIDVFEQENRRIPDSNRISKRYIRWVSNYCLTVNDDLRKR
jgi:chromosome segregation ATPase